MNEIRDFVNTFNELYTQEGYAQEEDQNLPSVEILNEICSTKPCR